MKFQMLGIGDGSIDYPDEPARDGGSASDGPPIHTGKNQFRPPRTAVPASKWVVMGTSKGQVILHNCAASYLSFQSKKMNSQPGANLVTSICPSAARTITTPLRHKKCVTCGAWLDNLLVFGSVGSGSLTVVSTFPKTTPTEGSSNVIKAAE